MTREEIIRALRDYLADLPQYPDPDTDSALREYDEDLNQGLEALRDLCRLIVDDEPEVTP